ncbi:MAG: hypothetical protein IGS50_11510 [Synechococcales cyanobacterium C42_A2020_086]|nr:hypothetical protein [Synechococcales cyanobacterium C42_A2020_086]
MTRLFCHRSPHSIAPKSLLVYCSRQLSQVVLGSLSLLLLSEALATGLTQCSNPRFNPLSAEQGAHPILTNAVPPPTLPPALQVVAEPVNAAVEQVALYVRPAGGKVNIRFINETGAAINYEVIGETQYRTLAGRSQMLLENLPVPTTFTFRRADFGLLQVSLQEDTPASGTLTVRVRETLDFALDRTTIHVDPSGDVSLN